MHRHLYHGRLVLSAQRKGPNVVKTVKNARPLPQKPCVASQPDYKQGGECRNINAPQNVCSGLCPMNPAATYCNDDSLGDSNSSGSVRADVGYCSVSTRIWCIVKLYFAHIEFSLPIGKLGRHRQCMLPITAGALPVIHDRHQVSD